MSKATCLLCRWDREAPGHQVFRCWGCLYLAALTIIQIATLVVVLAGVNPSATGTATQALPARGGGIGHGNFCIMGGEEFFLGRDLRPVGVRGYRGLESWCQNHGGKIGWRP